jgi:hypothetical protein
MNRRAALLTILASGGAVADTTRPTCTITCAQTSPTAEATLNYTITFSESVTGFEVADFGITGGSKSALGGSGAVYTCDVTPTGDAPVVASVAEGVAQDGAGNTNTAATSVSIGIIVTYTYQPDSTTGVDTYVESGGNADANFGTNAKIRITGIRHGLLKFPISLAAGASVQSGTLSLWANGTLATNLTISIARILAANSGWAITSTWNYKTPTSARWAGDAASDGGADAGCSVSGTDYSATPIGSFNHASGDADATQYNITLDTTELATMCATNNGMHIWANSGADWAVCSCNHATAGQRPKLVLVVHYLP